MVGGHRKVTQPNTRLPQRRGRASAAAINLPRSHRLVTLPHPVSPSPLPSQQPAEPWRSVIQNAQYDRGSSHRGIAAFLVFIATIVYFFIVLGLISLAWKAAFGFKLDRLKSCQ